MRSTTFSASSRRFSRIRSSAAVQNESIASSTDCTRQQASARRRCGNGFVDGVAIAPRALQTRGDLVVCSERVAGEPELGIDGRELGDDVPVAIFQLRDVLLDELADLLVDRDRLQREALRRVELTDAIVGGDRLGVRVHPSLQITDLQQCPSVVRILLDDLLVLLDRPVELLLVDVLLCGLEYLLAVDGQMTLCFGNCSVFLTV